MMAPKQPVNKTNWSLLWAVVAFVLGNIVQVTWQASAKVETLQALKDQIIKMDEKVDALSDRFDKSDKDLAVLGERQKETNDRLDKLEKK